MFKKILLTVLLLIVVGCGSVLGIAAGKPDKFHFERQATIAAPPATVFATIDDLHSWPKWSPWEKLDPAMTKTFEGPETGVNSSYAWSGNDKVGTGRMTITQSEPDTHVGIKLEFMKPWTATNQVDFRLTPAGAGTQVVWSMDGTNNYMAKVVGVFMNMESMIGKDFDTGLAQLKTVAESAPAPAAADSTAGHS